MMDDKGMKKKSLNMEVGTLYEWVAGVVISWLTYEVSVTQCPTHIIGSLANRPANRSSAINPTAVWTSLWKFSLYQSHL